ncbi:VanW family protein [Aeromicrobium chenweiae]|uniref:YoaR-like putative peptidoglycan binding domain-containing protein n=1 Tax=Aeromicrobium chenweiae TaxID=2079793 RepID=A0A2S0WP11_9ACTN|nr:VanW family protein [Aeromicrobium chenweiae]AWB93042.1 hypothetical protein C3E78_12955 [Aeromicrobium chenweiae]TGN34031.1 hypothetical protein E4L97_02990 [Aeromicrobium chenweiae]
MTTDQPDPNDADESRTDADESRTDADESRTDADESRTDADESRTAPEAGLVVEDDELDLDLHDDEPAAPQDADDDEDPEPDDAFTDDEVEDVLGDDDPVSPDEDDADDEESADDEPVAAAPAHAVSDDPEDEHDLRPAHHPADVVVPASAFPDEVDEPRQDEEPPAGPVKKRKRHWFRNTLLLVIVLAGALYVAGYFLTGSRMPANAMIGGVDVGGKSPSAARTLVDRELSQRADRPIELTHGKKDFQIAPKDAGLALDVDGTVEAAGGRRSWDPRDMIALFAGDHETDPVLDVDDALLQSTIGTISESVDKDVVEAQITFPDGKPVARKPKPGLVVSKSDTADAIRSTYLVSDKPITVPTVEVEPSVDEDALADAMDTTAKTAVSGPVTLSVGDKDVELPVSAYAPALVIRVENGRLTPRLDAKKLAGPLTDSTTGIGKKAVDATVRIQNGKPVVVPGKEGLGLQPKEMATKLVPVLSRTGDERTLEVEAKVVKPLFTTKDAKALKITEKISEFETSFPYAEYRNTNQGRAAELMDGTLIKPGETFSFNDVVGERTEANGFVNGTVINGGVFREELGGGVSQVATTMYNAGFFGGMDDVEHHPHAFYIDRYPVGREATVYFGSLDLRWKNPTKYGVLVRSYVKKSTPSSPGRMHVELWSTKVWDKIEAGRSERRNGRTPGTQYDDTNRCVPQGPVEGFDIDIYRTFFRDGKKVKTETDTANYQAADRVVCGKKPKGD